MPAMMQSRIRQDQGIFAAENVFQQAVKAADSEIRFFEQRGKGSHLMLCKQYPEGKRSFPLPTTSGEVAGPYQSKIIALYDLPKDVFQKRKR